MYKRQNQDGAVTVDLEPAAPGVLTAEFDMNLSSLSKQYITVTAADGNGSEIIKLRLDTYNNPVTAVSYTHLDVYKRQLPSPSVT